LEGRVYFGDSLTNFYALDAATGREAWHTGAEAEIKAGANWMRSPDGKSTWILAGSWDSRLYCWDAATGKTNWVYETGNRINGAPAAGEGVTVFGGCDNHIHVVRLTDGTKIKEIDAGAPIAATAALVGGRAYVGHYENEFLCADLAKGEIAWRYRDRAFPFMSSPAVTTNRVLVGARDKRLHCIDRATGQGIWTFQTRGKVESSAVVAGDKVVFGSDDGRLYLVALADGRELWNYEIGQPVQASAAVVDGHIVIGADDGVVYCFGPKK
jgi:outer membrane protein assembly factor BamB